MTRWLGAAVLLVGCGGDDPMTDGDPGTNPSPTRAEAILALTPDLTAGQASYEGSCGFCHGDTGAGDVGPSIQGQSAADTVDVMLDPPENMSSFDFLEDQELADIAAYVETL